MKCHVSNLYKITKYELLNDFDKVDFTDWKLISILIYNVGTIIYLKITTLKNCID